MPLLLSPLTTWTRADPLAGALDLAHRLEQAPGVWSITVSGGFPYAEHGALGCSVLAYADTQQLADACAQQVAQELWSRRAAAAYTGFTPGEAVARAASLAGEGDVVLLSPASASFDLYRNFGQHLPFGGDAPSRRSRRLGGAQ